MCSARIMQKQQYLQGFLQKTCKHRNIYQVFCNMDAKSAIKIKIKIKICVAQNVGKVCMTK